MTLVTAGVAVLGSVDLVHHAQLHSTEKFERAKVYLAAQPHNDYVWYVTSEEAVRFGSSSIRWCLGTYFRCRARIRIVESVTDLKLDEPLIVFFPGSAANSRENCLLLCE